MRILFAFLLTLVVEITLSQSPKSGFRQKSTKHSKDRLSPQLMNQIDEFMCCHLRTILSKFNPLNIWLDYLLINQTQKPMTVSWHLKLIKNKKILLAHNPYVN